MIMVALTLAAVGIYAAASVPVRIAVGNLGGLAGPSIVGVISAPVRPGGACACESTSGIVPQTGE